MRSDAAGPKVIDLTGLKCPLPALKTGRALGRARPGEILVVICTDPMAAIDIPNLCRERGRELIETTRDERTIVFRIRA